MPSSISAIQLPDPSTDDTINARIRRKPDAPWLFYTSIVCPSLDGRVLLLDGAHEVARLRYYDRVEFAEDLPRLDRALAAAAQASADFDRALGEGRR